MNNRRKFLKSAGLTAIGITVTKSAVAETCGLTPAQTEGPFYPESWANESDADLTYLKDRRQHAIGEKIALSGRVLDSQCQPIPGAIVEIWQAAASGKYNHSRDPNTSALDPNFQYWGRVITDGDGGYAFLTIVPGEYPAAPGWIRPPHIHVKVLVQGQRTLTTQFYFEGNRRNKDDQILQSLSKAEQDRVMISLTDVEGEDINLAGERDITLDFTVGGLGTPELD